MNVPSRSSTPSFPADRISFGNTLKPPFRNRVPHTLRTALCLGLLVFFVPIDAQANFRILGDLNVNRFELAIQPFVDIAPSGSDSITPAVKLRKRAFAMLTRAGFEVAPLRDPLQAGDARLVITLMAVNLAKADGYGGLIGTPGIVEKELWIIDSEIALWEWTNSSRNPNLPILTRTWGKGRTLPVVRAKVKYADIEGEMVRLLKTFITEFQWANPPPPDSE